MRVIVGIRKQIVNDSLMDIKSYKIRRCKRRHRASCKRTEHGIDIVNTAVVFQALRILQRLIDKLKSDTVSEKCRCVLRLNDRSVKNLLRILFQLRESRWIAFRIDRRRHFAEGHLIRRIKKMHPVKSASAFFRIKLS